MTTTPPAPTVTVHTDAAPCPRAEVLVTPMPGDAATVTVWRSWRGQRAIVRGAKNALVAGDYLVIDYEVPLGTAVAYSAVTQDAAAIPSEESSPTTVAVAVSDVWVQDPLDPTTALQVGMPGLGAQRSLNVTAPSFTATYSGALTKVSPVGSRRPFALGGTLQTGGRIPLTIHATNPTAATQLQDLLVQSWPTLCVRTPAKVITLDGLTYLAIAEFTPDPGIGWEEFLFPLVGDSAIDPGAGVVVQPRTFDHLLDEAATFDDLISLYPTFIDLQRGP